MLIKDPFSTTGLAGAGATSIKPPGSKQTQEDPQYLPPTIFGGPVVNPLARKLPLPKAPQSMNPGKLGSRLQKVGMVDLTKDDGPAQKIYLKSPVEYGGDVTMDWVRGVPKGTTIRDIIGDRIVEPGQKKTAADNAAVHDDVFFKQASHALPITPFAAAFFVGCAQAGLSYDRFQEAVKQASTEVPEVADELAVFRDESQPLMRKYAFAGAAKFMGNLWRGGGEFMGNLWRGGGDDVIRGARNAFNPLKMAPAGAEAAGAKALPQAVALSGGPGTRGAPSMMNRMSRFMNSGGPVPRYGGDALGATGHGSLAQGAKSLFRNVVQEPVAGAATGYSLGTVGDLGAQAMGYEDPGLRNYGAVIGGAARMPFLRRTLLKGTQSSSPLVRGVSRPLASAQSAFVDTTRMNPFGKNMTMMQRANSGAGALGLGMAGWEMVGKPMVDREVQNRTNEAIQQASGGMFNSMEEWQASPMYRVLQAYNQDGVMGALQSGWNELTPQQQQYLMGAAGLGVAGLGAAAMGHPWVGAGLGAAGLGLGGYGLYSGGGNVAQQMIGGLAPESQQQLLDWFSQNPEAYQELQNQPRNSQAALMSQLIESLMSQDAGQELQRASG